MFHIDVLYLRFSLKGAPKVKEVLAKNVPYAREAPKINFDRVFHTKAKTRSKLILEASKARTPFTLRTPFKGNLVNLYLFDSICSYSFSFYDVTFTCLVPSAFLVFALLHMCGKLALLIVPNVWLHSWRRGFKSCFRTNV